MTREDLFSALTHDNVQAFLRLIREGESSQDKSAYFVMFGGGHFTSYEDHPRIKNTRIVRGKPITSTAAGAYQFLARTWDEMAKKYGLNDFGETNQDLAAVGLIHRRGALQDVIAGRVHEAIRKCVNEWASLPGAKYDQPTQALNEALRVYQTYGGRIASATTTTPTKESKMPAAPLAIAAVQAFLPALVELLPKLGSMFGSGSESQQRNVAAATMVADAVVKATNTPNLQSAIEEMTHNPEALQAASEAVDELWPRLGEAGGGGIKGARDFAEKHMEGRGGRILEIVTYAVLVYLLIANGLALTVFVMKEDSSLLNTVIQADIGAALMGLGFWLGTSVSSRSKDAVLAEQVTK